MSVQLVAGQPHRGFRRRKPGVRDPAAEARLHAHLRRGTDDPGRLRRLRLQFLCAVGDGRCPRFPDPGRGDAQARRQRRVHLLPARSLCRRRPGKSGLPDDRSGRVAGSPGVLGSDAGRARAVALAAAVAGPQSLLRSPACRAGLPEARSRHAMTKSATTTATGRPVWEVIDRRTLLRTTRDVEVTVETVRLPDGRIIDDYYQVGADDSASVFAETEDGLVVTIGHYSHGARRHCIGLPAGRIGPEETAEDAARRELLEETGYAAAEWTFLGSFVRNGNQGGGTDHLFHARNAHRVGEPASGDLEEMEVGLMTRGELRDALQDNRIAVLAHALGVSLGLLRGEAPGR
ncbi:NUDIX hydrolase (plasmid) [Azospirillum sp. TSH100]|nr:NUDIX hydrolase [Azospirillum sp. TSH100]